MSYDRTVRVAAYDAARVFVASRLLEGSGARRHAEEMVSDAREADIRHAAFNRADDLIGRTIRNKLAYAPENGELYVKPGLLEGAIVDLSSIVDAAQAEVARVSGEIAETHQKGKVATDEAVRKLAAISALERDAGIVLALAAGARMLAVTDAD